MSSATAGVITLFLLATGHLALADLHVAVNPANAQAVRSLESNLRHQLTWNRYFGDTIHNCQRCAVGGTLGAVVHSIRGSYGTTSVNCTAQVGYTFTCSASTEDLKVDGRWYVGEYFGIPGSRDFRLPGATRNSAGAFTLTIRNYHPSWPANFTQSENNRIAGRTGGPGFVSRSINMPCRNTYPMPEGAKVDIKLAPNAGTETPELRELVIGLAHEAVAEHYCEKLRHAESGRYFMNLGDALQNRMTWQAVEPAQWIG